MKILIADDHPLFRTGVRHLLVQLDKHIELYEAGCRADIFEQIAIRSDWDLLLLDLSMPGANGISLLMDVVEAYPALPILVLSASDDREIMRKVVSCGALGFIQKSAPPTLMLNACRLVLAGGMYIPPVLVRHEQIFRTCKLDSNPAPTPDELTSRQIVVLNHVAEGKSNKVIAAELGLAESTVKAHITAVFKALRVRSRMQAAMTVRDSGKYAATQT